MCSHLNLISPPTSVRADRQLWCLTSRHSVCPLCNLRLPTSGFPQYPMVLLFYPSLMGDNSTGLGSQKTQKIQSLMSEEFLVCFLNSLTGISWRMLCNSQVSPTTWKQLRRRWVLMVMSLWISFSSLITFVLSRWAEQLHCHRKQHPFTMHMEETTECQHPLIPVGTPVPFWAIQSVYRNCMPFLKSKMWSQPCSRMDEDSSPLFMFLLWNPVSLSSVMK